MQPTQKKLGSKLGKIPINNKYDHMFKIIIIGDPTCGKTSMLVRVAEQRANETYNMTIGVDCKTRMYTRGDKKIKLQLWDTAGQEKFRNLTTSYYRGTHCCILVFDITNIQSFYNLFKWIDQYNYFCDYAIKNIIIVANKIDLEA